MKKPLVLTCLALLCFAANSLLCRQAFLTGSIDPATFTLVRIGSGALFLSVLLGLRRPVPSAVAKRRFAPGLALFSYAALFSFAYVTLSAGVGAVVLFATVQATMVAWGIARGEKPRITEWAGLFIAFCGLVWLVLPGAEGAPSIIGVLMMTASGAAWGAYSSLDRRGVGPLIATAGNFRVALVPAGATAIVAGLATGLDAGPAGIAYAVTSGAIASGFGYCLWYAALPALSAAQAAVVQLTVPVITALGGVLLLGETLLPRSMLATAMILGGVALAVLTRRRKPE